MRTFPARSALFTALFACAPLAFAAAAPPATATSTTSTSTTTTSTHAAGHHGKHMRQHRMGMLDKLDLTDAQHASVHQLMQQSFTEARPAMQSLREQRIAFERATPGSADYQTAANTLAQAESDAAHARVLHKADLRSKIYNVLTPAQRTKLASLREQRETRMQKWKSTHHTRHTLSTPTTPAPTASSR